MPVEVRDATEVEKLRFLAERVVELAADLKLDSVVIVTELGQTQNVSRWPPCTHRCAEPKFCTSSALRRAGSILYDTADHVEGA